MVTDLWTLVCLIAYNGKIWPIKSRNEDAVTYFLVSLVVLTQSIYMSDMGPVNSICTHANRQMDGQTNKQTDGQMDGWMPDVTLCDELC